MRALVASICRRSLERLAFEQPLEELVSELLVIGAAAEGAEGGSVSMAGAVVGGSGVASGSLEGFREP